MPQPHRPNDLPAAIVYSATLADLDLGPTHPLKPVRYRHTYELMRASGLTNAPGVVELSPRAATEDEVARYHTKPYIAAVKDISAGGWKPEYANHGFGPGDNPPVPGIFEAATLCAGGSILACDVVSTGKARSAFSMAGGVHHHAMAGRAAGFGIFNDAVIAIRGLIDQGLRVAYVDIDCHHGDGVQAGFYDDPRVLTISIHESGQFLFPGTGFVNEIGRGEGEGYSVNIPLAPYTSDNSWLWAFDKVVPPLVKAYKPDLVFTQLGIDTHYKDPITHLRLTTQGFRAAVDRLKQLGEACPKGWVAVGGGGYDLGAVARAWTMAFATMADYKLPDRVPDSFTSVPGLTMFEDEPPPALEAELETQIRAYAERVVAALEELVFPKLGAS